jgi:hypothetical protein
MSVEGLISYKREATRLRNKHTAFEKAGKFLHDGDCWALKTTTARGSYFFNCLEHWYLAYVSD